MKNQILALSLLSAALAMPAATASAQGHIRRLQQSLCAASSVFSRFRVPLGTLIGLVRLHPRIALSDFYSSGQEVCIL